MKLSLTLQELSEFLGEYWEVAKKTYHGMSFKDLDKETQALQQKYNTEFSRDLLMALCGDAERRYRNENTDP